MDWHVIEIKMGRHYILKGLSIIQHTCCDLLGKFDVAAAKSGVTFHRKNIAFCMNLSEVLQDQLKIQMIFEIPAFVMIRSIQTGERFLFLKTNLKMLIFHQ